jgi:hypothetical protein
MLAHFFLCVLGVLSSYHSASSSPPAGFAPLWNGKDLSGWHYMDTFDPRKLAAMSESDRAAKLAKWASDSAGHWRIEGNEIVNDGKGAFLTTDKDYGDIELLIEYKTVPKADSGIYLRGCPQVQIWDSTEEAKFKLGADKGSGGLWNNSPGTPGKDPLVKADKPFGEWNKFRIVMVGERVSVWLNDQKVVDHARMENYFEKDRRKPLPRTGPIQLQTHGGEIRWRNLYVREIPPDEANHILRQHGDTGFAEAFNGRDFTGWAGPTKNYEVKDGAIVCQPKKGGTIYTDKSYGDFVARLEYQLPPGGNNGLAIRYPGQGDAAYDGMCEIQILDDTDEARYAKLDARQFNGSAYGMIAAQKGYLRPVGEWNFMEVTVKGPTIVVELNGTRILDGDVSKVTEYLGGKPHPGKDRTRGHFGFCGHSDPVAFRNVQIRELK